jgi:hypothetical protein
VEFVPISFSLVSGGFIDERHDADTGQPTHQDVCKRSAAVVKRTP